MKETAMSGNDLDRYFRYHELRADLEMRARRERAETVGKLLVAAAHWIVRLPARLQRLFACWRNSAQSVS
jgi:hypothetical protein